MAISNILKKLNHRDTKFLPRFSKISKVIIFSVLAVSTIFFVKNILAADNIIKQTQDAQKTSNNAESWQLNSWNTTAINALTTMTGEIPFKDDGTIDTEKFKLSGLLGTSTNMVAVLYNPQASGVEYIAQIKDNFLGKPTYAQGVSFGSENNLQPLLPMWKALRNIVYSLSAIIFVVIGIMIMLRVKISPQAVISVQTAIPKIVTSLILVTFSYAIAGLVIDISNWIQAFILVLIFNAKGANLGSNLYNQIGYQSIASLDIIDPNTYYNFKGLMNADFTKLSMLANRTVPMGSLFLLGVVVGQVVLGSLLGGLTGLFGSSLGLVGNVLGQGLGDIVGAAGGIIFMIILFIIIAIWLIKLFFGLLKTYVAIILKIITGPLEIGMGAFSNSKVNFSSWIIDLISKVAVFPVVLIALVFTNYLIEISTTNLWVPNLMRMTIPGSGMVLGAAIGLAGLAMISKLPDLVPAAIFKLKPSEFGKAIGESFDSSTKWAKGTASSTGKAGVDYADERFGEGSSFWKQGLRATNRILGGKYSRKRIEDASTTQSDKKV